jgi:hypothetical protein
MLRKLYQWLWFRLEFWLTPLDRRPLTFIFRDWIYPHAGWFALIVFIFYAGMIALSIFGHGTISTILTALGSLVIAHLVWGSAWIEKQQEFPEYLGD